MTECNVVILGAGPAGLAAGYELAKRGEKVVCLEKDNVVGGISRTVCHNGFRFDIGGHRFFTKVSRVDELWREILEEEFLRRPRLSRIYYNNKFFNYPLKLTNALMGLGAINSVKIVASFIASKIHPYPQENTFEEWVSNRFGKQLFIIFFQTYTEKVWGIPCKQIQAEWAAQRIKGLSLPSAIKTALFGDKQKLIKTLIHEFDYPRFGPGQMYETMAEKIQRMGGKVLLGHKVKKLQVANGKIVAAEVVDTHGNNTTIEGTDFLSSLPIDELALAISKMTVRKIIAAANNLSYRSILTVNLMLNHMESFHDTWIYIHSPQVSVGRIQCFKNWSPYMVPNENYSSLGLEYFCTENDEFWNCSDEELIELAKNEIKQLNLADPENNFDAFVVRMPKTYPIYSTGYKQHLQTIKNYISEFPNLQCIGRNGMFKYNNMDHSILTALLAVENIFGANNDIWCVNTDHEYHECAKT